MHATPAKRSWDRDQRSREQEHEGWIVQGLLLHVLPAPCTRVMREATQRLSGGNAIAATTRQAFDVVWQIVVAGMGSLAWPSRPVAAASETAETDTARRTRRAQACRPPEPRPGTWPETPPRHRPRLVRRTPNSLGDMQSRADPVPSLHKAIGGLACCGRQPAITSGCAATPGSVVERLRRKPPFLYARRKKGPATAPGYLGVGNARVRRRTPTQLANVLSYTKSCPRSFPPLVRSPVLPRGP